MIPDARALLDVNTHYVTNQPNSQNDGALATQDTSYQASS